MTQLYPSTAGNGVWVLPGSHQLGKADIKKLVADAAPTASRAPCRCCATRATRSSPTASSCTARSPTARPTGASRSTRASSRASACSSVTTRRLNGEVETYDQARIDERSRILQIAIDARRQRFPQETATSTGRWPATRTRTAGTRRRARRVLKNYNQRDMFIYGGGRDCGARPALPAHRSRLRAAAGRLLAEARHRRANVGPRCRQLPQRRPGRGAARLPLQWRTRGPRGRRRDRVAAARHRRPRGGRSGALRRLHGRQGIPALQVAPLVRVRRPFAGISLRPPPVFC